VSQFRECYYSIIDAADSTLYAVTSSMMNDSCNFLASNGFFLFALYSLVFVFVFCQA